MTEEKFREIFAGTGWDVSYVDESDEPGGYELVRPRESNDPGGYEFVRQRKARVTLTSGGVKIIAGTTWRRYGQNDEAEFRALVFENAARDLSGEARPDFDHWSFPNFTSDIGFACTPKWLKDGRRCLVSSVEEFAFKLVMLGPGENPGNPWV